MSTFLQLTQDAVRESRTVSGTRPTTVVSQTGRLLRFVEWTAQAWVDIQNRHKSWRWMQATYSGATTAGTKKYLAASFGISDFRDWLRDDSENGYRPHASYLTATGVSDEGALIEITWQDYRQRYDRGAQTNNPPIHYAISPTMQFCINPPDDTYTIVGEYRKSATVLASDSDTPEMPADFHQLICWGAVVYSAESDEAHDKKIYAQMRYDKMMGELERDQLPKIIIGSEPVA